MKKIYKPGQIVTAKYIYLHNMRYRIKKCDTNKVSCMDCDLNDYIVSVGMHRLCVAYCARLHNDYEKNPNGYVLKRM